ncbi:cytochrome P450 [Spongiactinospora sp. TRM90649]|uniref:cytochrome P450 family protein n=1 Tax=Spongiactinospora sp. TRM90649 TaxID=3031114 RepID=UPI0023F99199|nr:cytochrome P450 [Spongiactinospora sp. TRM90649]MDF5758674.1 cytochrome P450 [Spongiactinospora sp. TRM90649]
MPSDDLLPAGPGFVADPYPYYAGLRRSHPVRFVRFDSGLYAWLVTRYEDARLVLSDPRLSKDPGNAPADWQEAGRGRPLEDRSGLGSHLLTLDPPEHTRLRSVVSRFFHHRRLGAIGEVIEEAVASLLRGLAGAGEADLIARYAKPLQATVICEILGIPPGRRGDFGRWCDAVVSSDPDGDMTRGEALRALAGHIGGLIEDKRREPGDDVISTLAHAAEPSRDEVLAYVFLLLVAGYETTINLIGNGVLALLRHPGQLARLRGRPEALETAVEELLRYDSPAEFSTWRFTLTPVEVGDTVIPAGQPVLVALSSANRDAAAFADADALDLGRADNAHLSFGHGAHYCLGAALARLEGRIAIGALIREFPGMALAVDPERLEWRSSLTVRGPLTLPVRLR